LLPSLPWTTPSLLVYRNASSACRNVGEICGVAN
jgi:hypothetical protein